ncbi:MAG: thioredoxin [Methanomassiliicoccaceae archaeon]|nr:thioredoxin [Methanomassiliicoccaceae archaeon]MCL2143771.1 thioredoxin [Methanomassiliicoccaceae archaeon]
MIKMVTELNDGTFDKFIEGNKLVLVDCWAPWCRPCRMLAPIIEELAEELKDKVAVGKLNTDDNQGIAYRFGINAIPTLLVFKDGVMHEPLVGLRPKEEIRDYVLGL